MSKIDDLSKKIDSHITAISEAVRAYTATSALSGTHAILQGLAEEIDLYRLEVSKEIEGLKGDVKSAEAAYEREGLRLNEIQRQRDQWKDDHDRVAKEKHQLQQAYDSNVAELKALALHAGDLEQDRDEWKRDAATSETKLEKAIEERDAALDQAHQLRKSLYEERGGKTAVQLETENAGLKQQLEKAIMQRDASRRLVESLMTAGTSLNNGVPMYAMDPGAPEGDKTVISFECCNVKHTFSPPKSMQWTHAAQCPKCGSTTKINS